MIRPLPLVLSAALAAGLAAGLGSSCSVVELRIDQGLDLAECNGFKEGEASLGDVLVALGPPVEFGARGEQIALLYESVRLRETQLGISLGAVLGAGAGDYFKFSYGSSGTDRKAALFLFSEGHVLEGVNTLRFEEPFGRSGSIQVLVTVDEVVSTGGLRASPDAFVEPRELLNGIQWSQNLTHSALVELRGARGRMGQHTLDPELSRAEAKPD